MKIYIFADLEGISGISGDAYVNGPFAAIGSALMAKEINTCVEACFAAGASEVVVRDGHGCGVNFPVNQIDPRAAVIQGAVPGVRFPAIENSSAMILLGYHAMAGTAQAVLEHTFSSKTIQNLYLNGEKIGEIGIDAAIAAEHGVPVILVTGDDKTCEEANKLLPEVEVCCVKTGLACHAACSLPANEASKLLTQSIKLAIAKIGSIPLYKPAQPITIRWENTERTPVPSSGVTIIEGRTYEKTGSSVEEILLR